MSRRNYIHTMDSLIGKPYSNAAGVIIDPNTGLEETSATFARQEAPANESVFLPTPPIVAVTAVEGDDLGNIRIEEERRIAKAKVLAQIEAQKQASLNAPIIVVPPSYVAPPLIVGGGGGGGGGGGAAISGAKPVSSAIVVAEPSFIKKNFIPLLLVTAAIYVFIKNPIK